MREQMPNIVGLREHVVLHIAPTTLNLHVYPPMQAVSTEDVFGESVDDQVTRALDQHAASSSVSSTGGGGGGDNEAKLLAAISRLKAEFGPARKAVLVAYNLPVVLHKRSTSGGGGSEQGSVWTASWLEDDFIARSPNSIADGECGVRADRHTRGAAVYVTTMY